MGTRNDPVRIRTDIRPETKRTRSEFLEECDVNKIMGQYRRHGFVSHLAQRPPRYGDFTNVTDYLTAVTAVKEAEKAFQSLPARVRDYCGNDPATFLQAMANPEALEQMKKLGLKEQTPTNNEGGVPPSSPAPAAPSSPAAPAPQG